MTDRNLHRKLSLEDSIVHAGRTYNLLKDSSGLNLEIIPPDFKLLNLDQTHAEWGVEKDCYRYILEISRNRNFSTGLQLETDQTKYDFFNLPGGSYYVRVNANGIYTEAGTFYAKGSSAPMSVQTTANGTPNAIFASSGEVWRDGFVARHVGSVSQKGTDEGVLLAGKNRFRDVFFGSADADLLCLTDSANGDVLFLDDVYSEYGGAGRLSNLDEIRAGAGDDVIDLTSNRYGWSAGSDMVIRGGDGNDVIWANSGSNRIFGDAGNDRIIGGAGNDVIAGGAGNDKLRGNGGTDLFTFGGDWGNDTVGQLADGAVVLWFESGDLDHWDAETLTYTDGTNSVQVSGVSAEQITLYFGAGENYGTLTYSELASLGAFKGSSSKCIWEQLA